MMVKIAVEITDPLLVFWYYPITQFVDVDIGGKLVEILPVVVQLYEEGSTPKVSRHQEGAGTKKVCQLNFTAPFTI